MSKIVEKQKIISRRILSKAIKTGELVPQPCVVCGTEKVHGHHEDYSRPLDVIWLCPAHHFERHRKYPREAEIDGFVPMHPSVPRGLYEKVILIKKREGIYSNNELVEISLKLLVDFYERKGGKV